MLALLVDWGYRPDGIPVRLFDAWTTLPAGPASLAAKTGSRILPVTIRRTSDARIHLSWSDPIEVPSSSPADLLRATQQIADSLAGAIGAAPEQWYSFKPIWPSTAEESAALERRAIAALAGGTAAALALTDSAAGREVEPTGTNGGPLAGAPREGGLAGTAREGGRPDPEVSTPS
jgi:KDO2-lipid IV(A) lauroyltransferase